MSPSEIPEDILAQMFLVFCANGKVRNAAYRRAMEVFLNGLLTDDPQVKMPHDKARAFLSNQPIVESFIADIKEGLEQDKTKIAAQACTKENAKIQNHFQMISVRMSKNGQTVTPEELAKWSNRTNPFVRFIAVEIAEKATLKNFFLYVVGAGLAISVGGNFLTDLSKTLFNKAAEVFTSKPKQHQSEPLVPPASEDRRDQRPPVHKPAEQKTQFAPTQMQRTPYGFIDPNTGRNLGAVLDGKHEVGVRLSNGEFLRLGITPPQKIPAGQAASPQ